MLVIKLQLYKLQTIQLQSATAKLYVNHNLSIIVSFDFFN